MKRISLCLVVYLCIFIFPSAAQNCSTLQFTYFTTPSRCMATGSISIKATGGSGNYNYEVISTDTSRVTSSPVITGLRAGTYSILVRDNITRCLLGRNNIIVEGSYSDPRFFLSKTDVTCKGNDGTINMYGLEEGRAPFSFTIVSPSPAGRGTTNATGNFANLVPGEYSIELKDSCGGVQVRRITIESFNWFFDRIDITKIGCDSANVRVLLNDNKGNGNISNAAFTGFKYGVVRAPGDTLWFNNPVFSISLINKYSVTVVVKDPCGNLRSITQSFPAGTIPSAGPVVTGNFTCNTFTAAVTGLQNITDPQFCLYNAGKELVGCNTSGIFDNLPYGEYCIKIVDECFDTTIARCFTGSHPLPAAGNVIRTNQNCFTFTATVTGGVNQTNPQFCIYDANSNVVACNTTGIFDNLPYGRYCIKIKDGCYDTTIVRCFTENRPVPIIQSVNVISDSCNAFDVDIISNADSGTLYCLYDRFGNQVRCTTNGVFDDIPQGQYCVTAITSCGDTTAPMCFATQLPRPSVGDSVRITDKTCNTFTASLFGQTNVTTPQYCLYTAAGAQVTCNSTGIFTGLPYGDYCMTVKDGCYDTTIRRCFSATRPVVVLSATMTQTDKTCNSFTLRLTSTNFTNPQYCLYNGQNVQVGCNSTGVFTNLPYDEYCATIKDGCYDTIISVCQSYAKVRGVTLSTYKTCSIGYGMVAAQAKSVNNPFTFTFYHPNGSVLYTTNTWSGYASRELPALPTGDRYKILVVDNCGDRDSAFIAPDATIITKQVSAVSKCPSGTWPQGSGDVVVNCRTNLFRVRPRLIKKNGDAFNQSYSNTNGYDNYNFSDLEPATYIIEYSMDQCTGKVYDTFQLRPYQAPVNIPSAIYQCDSDGFSMAGNVTGGIGPFHYEIIGSQPATPSIVTLPQSSPLFNINNGIRYSLVRLRSTDACGNAALNDASVLPLQNIIITASSTCLYRSVTLSVDTIPNAIYEWYKRTGPGDSVLLTSNVAYYVPYMSESDMGTYVCKVRVNNGCLTRISEFNFDGQCDDRPLPVSLVLRSKPVPGGNQLEWSGEGTAYTEYVVERAINGTGNFIEIARLKGSTGDNIVYIDKNPYRGQNAYRVLATIKPGFTRHSNTVVVDNRFVEVIVSPNPADDVFYVSIPAETGAACRMELVNIAGKVVYRKEIRSGTDTKIAFYRNALPAGMYALKITDVVNGSTRIFKVQFR